MTASDALIPADTFAAGLGTKTLQCRELGHTWRPRDVSGVVGGGYLRIMRCTACRTERRQTLDSVGAVLANTYVYAEGYLADNVEPGFSRDVFRLESISRWLEGHTLRQAG